MFSCMCVRWPELYVYTPYIYGTGQPYQYGVSSCKAARLRDARAHTSELRAASPVCETQSLVALGAPCVLAGALVLTECVCVSLSVFVCARTRA